MTKSLASIAPKWSKLGEWGRTRLAKATIATPLLGTALLLTQNLHDLLKTDAETAQLRGNIFESTHENSVYLIYFGFTALGIGSALFLYLTPRQCAKTSDPVEYAAVAPANSATLLLREIYDASTAFTSASRQSSRETFLNSPGAVSFCERITEAFRTIRFTDPANADILPDKGIRLASTTKGPDPLKLIAECTSNVALLKKISQACSTSASEIYITSYLIHDETRPLQRLFIAIFFFAGFSALAAPTLATFMLIWF